MFKELLNKIKKSKQREIVTKEIKNDENSEILLTNNGGILKMSILGNPSLDVFFEKVRELPKEEKDTILSLPLSILVNSKEQVHPGNYIWTTIINKRYIIISNKDMISINETKKLNDVIEERSVSIDNMSNAFSVYKAVHDSNYSTLEHKRFDSSLSQNPSEFSLSPQEAKNEFELLFDDLIQEGNILNELKGVIEIDSIKDMIDNYFSYIKTDHQSKR